jgi:hypothetical protein
MTDLVDVVRMPTEAKEFEADGAQRQRMEKQFQEVSGVTVMD